MTRVSVPRPKALRQGERATADARARREPVPRLLEYVSKHRLVILIVLHALVLASIYWLCYVIRFDGAIPPAYLRVVVTTLPLVVVLKMVILLKMGSLRGLWRQFTFADMTALAGSTALGSIALTSVDLLNHNWLPVPHSIIVMDCAGTLLVLGGLRGSLRFFRENYYPMVMAQSQERVLIVGAGSAGETVAHTIRGQPQLGMKVVGFLDPDQATHGWTLGGVKVLGPPEAIGHHAGRLGIRTILVPATAFPGQRLRALASTCSTLGVKVKVIPPLATLLNGAVDIRPRDVDIHDLLCREPVHLDSESIGRFLHDRVVLVTGAAGSIGSEICRQVLAFRPGQLILLDHSENGLFFLERELQALAPEADIIPCVTSITDAARLRAVFVRHSPEVVFHAAAHKHVPMMEANPGEAVKNNVFGTRTLVDEAIDSGVEAFVMISTDKAVNPACVMGACKRLAEMYVQTRSEQTSARLVTVRFGNVLGSSGSVVPLFKEQIRQGGPVTVTHPEMTRYFMLIPEAAQLVLEAGAFGRGGEIFVLDMGEPVGIPDLARDLIRLSGLREDEDIEITFTGLRPGEKLHEELYDRGEEALPTPHPKIFLARHRPCEPEPLQDQLAELARRLDGPADEVVAALQRLVPEYRPARLSDGSLWAECSPGVHRSNGHVAILGS
ncbi:MAG: polysaccharide biosynthesis protein [Planctomycetaceae bacterium]|nr:polysaccharide biosynthesis protein [Planctomycetaceae bacterium]